MLSSNTRLTTAKQLAAYDTNFSRRVDGCALQLELNGQNSSSLRIFNLSMFDKKMFEIAIDLLFRPPIDIDKYGEFESEVESMGFFTTLLVSFVVVLKICFVMVMLINV